MKSFIQHILEKEDPYGYVDDEGKKQTRDPFHLYPDMSKDSAAPVMGAPKGEIQNTRSAGSSQIMAAKLRNKKAGRPLDAGLKGIERQVRSRQSR